MSNSRRIAFLVLVATALLVGLVVVLIVLVDADAYREKVEAAASDALGMDVSVEGRVGVRFVPALHVSLGDVLIHNRGTRIASAREARLSIEFLPLFRRDVRVRTIELQEPVLSVERDRDGRFNFERPEAPEGTLPAFALEKVTFSGGMLSYTDRTADDALEATGCDVELEGLRFSGGERAGLMRRLSFTAEIACGEVRSGEFVASELTASAVGSDGILAFDPVAMNVFDAQGTGDIRVDFTGEVPAYRGRYSFPQVELQTFFRHLASEKVAEGAFDFSADLSTRGRAVDEMKRNADGEFSMRGENLVLTGIDLDRSLARFEASQSFNLVDAGAIFLAGPFGLVATKGYKFAGLVQSSGGRSEIRTLVSDWRVERGVAHARDVAMTTVQNRMAAQGRLDFVNERFDGLTIALLDDRGCVRVKQELRGPFANAEAEKPNILELITGPTRSLIEKGMALFTEGECDVFYSGSVAPPR